MLRCFVAPSELVAALPWPFIILDNGEEFLRLSTLADVRELRHCRTWTPGITARPSEPERRIVAIS